MTFERVNTAYGSVRSAPFTRTVLLSCDLVALLLLSHTGVAMEAEELFESAVAIESGGYPWSVVACDVNGDNASDLVTATCGSGGEVQVLLGRGDGTFQDPAAFEAGSCLGSLSVADFNGDAFCDLVGFAGCPVLSPCQDGRLSVLLGNGDGTFLAPVVFPVATGARDVVLVSDIDRNGALDLVTDLGGGVAVLFGNGDGTFQEEIGFPTENHFDVGAISDLDGDTVPDLITANDSAVNVLLGRGDGTFGNASTFGIRAPELSRISALAALDLNGDGAPDLVAASTQPRRDLDQRPPGGIVNVLLGNGDGSFRVATGIPSGVSFSLATSDLDGDGIPDVVTGGESDVTVHLGDGTGGFGEAMAFRAGGRVDFVVLSDVDGDSFPDVVTAPCNCFCEDATCSYSLRPSILFGKGDGTFRSGRTFTAGANPVRVAASDFNGDATPDLAIANWGSDVSVLLGHGDGTFKDAVSYGTGVGASDVVVADFDGDSSPDLATATRSAAVSVLLGRGDGTFRDAAPYSVGDPARALVAADLDGDLSADLVAATETRTGGAVNVLLGRGDGTFGDAVTFQVGDVPSAVAVADLDGDDVPDLVTANLRSRDLSVLLGTGDGTFRTADSFRAGLSPTGVAIADLDGDRIPDLAAGGDSRAFLLIGVGDGSFHSPLEVTDDATAHFIGGDTPTPSPSLSRMSTAIGSSIWSRRVKAGLVFRQRRRHLPNARALRIAYPLCRGRGPRPRQAPGPRHSKPLDRRGISQPREPTCPLGPFPPRRLQRRRRRRPLRRRLHPPLALPRRHGAWLRRRDQHER